MTESQKLSARKYKAEIKERIRLSNEAVSNGLPPDPWVVDYRIKNNAAKAKWKAKQPKSEYIPTANSGSFKKGQIAKNKLSEEQKIESMLRRRIYVKKWYAENKDLVNIKRKEKKRTDPSFKIACNLRKRLSFVLSAFAAKKSQQTLKLLGCGMPEFMAHLESKFTSGMTWENYGQWHIDHKVPCALFDLTKPEQQAICFHYTNLQPLWAIDNLIKNKRV